MQGNNPQSRHKSGGGQSEWILKINQENIKIKKEEATTWETHQATLLSNQPALHTFKKNQVEEKQRKARHLTVPSSREPKPKTVEGLGTKAMALSIGKGNCILFWSVLLEELPTMAEESLLPLV